MTLSCAGQSTPMNSTTIKNKGGESGRPAQTSASKLEPAQPPAASNDLWVWQAEPSPSVASPPGASGQVKSPIPDGISPIAEAPGNIRDGLEPKPTAAVSTTALATIHDIPTHAFNVCGYDTRELLQQLSVEAKPSSDRLSAEEKRQQENLELQISAHTKADFERKLAFLIIRERKLYRGTFGTFAQYCERRWGIGRQQGHRHASDAEVVLQLGAAGFGRELPPAKALPKIHTIPARHRPHFWKWFLDNHAGAKRTMRQVAEACAVYCRNLGIQTPSVARLTEKQETERGILNDRLRQHLPKGVSDKIGQVLPGIEVSLVLRRAIRWSFNEVMRARSERKRENASGLTLNEMLELAPDQKTRRLMENYAAEALRHRAIKGTALYIAKTGKTHKKRRTTKASA